MKTRSLRLQNKVGKSTQQAQQRGSQRGAKSLCDAGWRFALCLPYFGMLVYCVIFVADLRAQIPWPYPAWSASQGMNSDIQDPWTSVIADWQNPWGLSGVHTLGVSMEVATKPMAWKPTHASPNLPIRPLARLTWNHEQWMDLWAKDGLQSEAGAKVGPLALSAVVGIERHEGQGHSAWNVDSWRGAAEWGLEWPTPSGMGWGYVAASYARGWVSGVDTLRLAVGGHGLPHLPWANSICGGIGGEDCDPGRNPVGKSERGMGWSWQVASVFSRWAAKERMNSASGLAWKGLDGLTLYRWSGGFAFMVRAHWPMGENPEAMQWETRILLAYASWKAFTHVISTQGLGSTYGAGLGWSSRP